MPVKRKIGGPPVHTPAAVEKAAAGLSRLDRKRLRAAARAILRGFGLHTVVRDDDDLVSEALYRTLSGSRSWRKGVDFTRHLAEAMRSIAWAWREREMEKAEAETGSVDFWDPMAVVSAEEATAELAVLVAPEPDPEQVAIAKEQVRMLERAFADDRVAREVLAGWAIGYKGPEIRRRCGITERELRAAIRRIRRLAQRG